ncbi:Asp-tRNA(Asn)/Glu-tRNA(Gln) amidotransferase subunit GatB [Candidatus Saccharibacteria bacterium]|nr:Asp-tRNA(Asn)/Glu-tRNA(Gln) amidotransferase subunit GatB [Candidatus Saccharibacteria bacterium]
MGKYVPTIGIECHVQLATKTKLFSRTDNDARQAEPNSKVSEIDFALPGMLPYLNEEAVRLAARAAKALNAKVANVSRFDRKHYFYPDLTKGYQISQMYQPTILAGLVELHGGVKVRINHAHLEEDAGKLTHHDNHSLVDLNRAGTPLIEIVSEPDIHSAADARIFAEELHKLMTFAEVTHGDLYHGNMRFDVNVSISDSDKLGVRTEIKNLNSFRSVEAVVAYEIKRQTEILESGGKVVQETRGWLDDQGVTTSQRSKENAEDYRYMPDPDIPPIVLSKEKIADLQKDFPKMPAQYRQEFKDLKVDSSVLNVILSNQETAEAVSQVLSSSGLEPAKKIANMFAGLSFEGDIKIPETADLVELAKMLSSSEINSNAGDVIFKELLGGTKNARKIATDKNLIQSNDEDEITEIIDQVLRDPAAQQAVDDVKSGNDKAIGFLVGQVMKASKGQANPGIVQKIIRQKIV